MGRVRSTHCASASALAGSAGRGRSAGRRIFDVYSGQGIADDVPALTYYLVLSLAPFALGIAAVQALLLNDLLSAIEVSEQLNRFLPDAVHEDVKDLIVQTRSHSP